jgi:hypothetical protein
VHTVSAFAHPASHAEGFAGVVVELAQAVPVGEFRWSAVDPAFFVVNISDQRVTVGCGAPAAVSGADEGF